MKQYWKIDQEYGIPKDDDPFGKLFLPEQEARAEKILKAVADLRICTALCLLERCKEAVMQSVVDVD